MSIALGDSLPDATLLRMTGRGPEEISLRGRTSGHSVVMVGLPGPFTDTCTEAHIPGFIRVREALGAQGVDEDPHHATDFTGLAGNDFMGPAVFMETPDAWRRDERGEQGQGDAVGEQFRRSR